jgi:hypothetical protein
MTSTAVQKVGVGHETEPSSAGASTSSMIELVHELPLYVEAPPALSTETQKLVLAHDTASSWAVLAVIELGVGQRVALVPLGVRA